MKAKPAKPAVALAVVGKLTSAELRDLCKALVSLVPSRRLAQLDAVLTKLERRGARRAGGDGPCPR